MFYTVFVYKNGLIICMKKGMQKVYEKLLAHPLFISDYVVYYARVGADVRMCVCVCYTIIWIDQIKRHKKTGRRKILLRCESCLMV